MWGIPVYKAIPYHPNVFDFALVVATLAMSVWEIPPHQRFPERYRIVV